MRFRFWQDVQLLTHPLKVDSSGPSRPELYLLAQVDPVPCGVVDAAERREAIVAGL